MRIALFCVALATTACSPGDSDSGHDHDGHHHHGDHAAGETVPAAMTDGGSYAVEFTVPEAGFPLSEEFDLLFTVQNAAGEGVADAELAVTAWMPDHGHGMNQEPTVSSIGEGSFRAAGMLLHMPGAWDVYADVTAAGETESATLSIRCCD